MLENTRRKIRRIRRYVRAKPHRHRKPEFFQLFHHRVRIGEVFLVKIPHAVSALPRVVYDDYAGFIPLFNNRTCIAQNLFLILFPQKHRPGAVLRCFERSLIGSSSRCGIVFFGGGNRRFFQSLPCTLEFYFIIRYFNRSVIKAHLSTVAAPEKSAFIA